MGMDHHHEDEVFEDKQPLTDRKQNFWQLAVIQSAAYGIPTIALGRQLAEKHGPGTALVSISIGNLILWVIALATVAMAYSERKNAIQNLRMYVGRVGSLAGGVVLLLAFLFWFSLQITSTTSMVKSTFPAVGGWSDGLDVRLGVALGLVISLLSLGGIKLIKWAAVFVFPLISFFLIYSVIMQKNNPLFSGSWGVSMSAIAYSIAITLPGIVNLPTFFRHAKSRSHAFFALTFITLFTICIECSGIWYMRTSGSANAHIEFLGPGYSNGILILGFIFLSLIVTNLVNIYFASAAWEAVVPKLKGTKKFAIVGMAGTVAYTFIQIRSPLFYVENMLDSFIANLGMVLVMAFLVQRIVSHRERGYEKALSLTCWALGCLAAAYAQIINSISPAQVFFIGIGVSSLAFLLVIFFEETLWSGNNCLFRKE